MSAETRFLLLTAWVLSVLLALWGAEPERVAADRVVGPSDALLVPGSVPVGHAAEGGRIVWLRIGAGSPVCGVCHR